MNPYRTHIEVEERRARHVPAATFSAGLSLLAHVVLIYWLAQLPVKWLALRPPDAQRSVRPMHVESVARLATGDEAAAVGRDAAGAGRPAAGAGHPMGTEPDMERLVASLRLTPDEVAIEPSAVPEDILIGESGNTAEPADFPGQPAWEPRREIMQVEERIVRDELPSLERRLIPRFERAPEAPSMNLQFSDVANLVIPEPRLIGPGEGAFVAGPLTAPAAVPRDTIAGSPDGIEAGPGIGLPGGHGTGADGSGSDLFGESPLQVTDIRPIEALLDAKVWVYSSLLDMKYNYFRIEIARAGPDVLPPLAKDILLVQDASNSITEQRLYFCRNGLLRCLTKIGPDDRFNIMSFQEETTACFPGWERNTPDSQAAARRFVEALACGGNTDIMYSLKRVNTLPRTPGRPLVVFLVSDGRPTAGLIDSSTIIGEFTRLNGGGVSVYTFGTTGEANSYLLDLLSYCNRGETRVVTSGRWDIPDAMEKLVDEVSRPVLTDIRLRVAEPATFEVFPALTQNLYLDRPLTLYGRYPKGNDRFVFQAVGQAGTNKCDMVFDLNLTFAFKSGDRDIRREWARHRIYDLIGRHTRRPDPAVLEEIRATADAYRVDIPYAKSLGL